MDVTFAGSKAMTLGVEVELQLLNKESWDLTPRAGEILAQLPPDDERIKHEIFQSMIEVNTGVCRDANEVARDLGASVARLRHLADRIGVRLAAVGTHPFARYRDRKLVGTDRYHALIDRNQWLARRLAIFGLHVHVGVESGDQCVRLTNRLLRDAHMLLAISASSPFWQGADTGLASARTTIFEALPTAGHPCLFRDWGELAHTVTRLEKSGAIRSFKDLWWDIRPSPGYGTMEIRICDGLTTTRETVALVAFIHALAIARAAEIESDPRQGSPPPLWLLRENKWRAARHGLDARVIVDDEGNTQPIREQIEQTMRALTRVETALGYRDHFKTLRRVIATGGSYTRQRRIFEQTSSVAKVAQLASLEFETDTPYFYAPRAAVPA